MRRKKRQEETAQWTDECGASVQEGRMSAALRYSYRHDTIIKSIFHPAACGRFRKEIQELSHKISVYCEYIELVLVG